jgi:hypothetical protein
MELEMLKMEDIETTSHIVMGAEDGSVLEFTCANDTQDRALRLNHITYGEIGFERKSDWMRLINKLNRYDDTPIKRVLTGDKKSSDIGTLKIHREDIDHSEDGILIEFKQPIKLLLETIGDNAVVVEVNKLKGKLTYEWSYSGSSDLDGYADFLEIYLYDIELIN